MTDDVRLRLTFWRLSGIAGGRWLIGIADHVGRLLLVLGLVGAPTVLALTEVLPLWAAGCVAAGIVLIALAEGAFAVWHAAEGELDAISGQGAPSAAVGSLRLHQLYERGRFLSGQMVESDRDFGALLADYQGWAAIVEQAIRQTLGGVESARWEDRGDWLTEPPVSEEDVRLLFEVKLDALKPLLDEAVGSGQRATLPNGPRTR